MIYTLWDSESVDLSIVLLCPSSADSIWVVFNGVCYRTKFDSPLLQSCFVCLFGQSVEPPFSNNPMITLACFTLYIYIHTANVYRFSSCSLIFNLFSSLTSVLLQTSWSGTIVNPEGVPTTSSHYGISKFYM